MIESIAFLVLTIAALSLQDPVVQLPNGKIRGREDTTAEGISYYAFQKIPYAASPVGNLRFQPPQPVENWDGVLNTTSIDTSCYQLNMFGRQRMGNPDVQSEDCLFLNVFTSNLPSEYPDRRWPVMVFIHGGGFTMGSSTSNSPPDTFINNDIVFVSLNYRLGVFGFISTQDEVIPGNNGLKDQLFALRWVHDNIELFGGDSARVTIFGQSAGAGSCAFLSLNQKADGLFNGVILESGTFLSTGMFQRNSREIAFGTGAVLDPTFESSDDSQALLELLLSVNADDLNAAAQTYSSSVSNAWDNLVEVGSIFAPVVEAKNPDAFITEKMYGLIKVGNVLPVPTIMGFTSEEKIGMVRGDDALEFILMSLDENLELVAPVDIPNSDTINRTQVGSAVRDIYTGGETFANHFGDAVRFGSDNFLGRPMIRHAEYLSKVTETYFYQFSFYGDLDATSNHYDGAGNVGHGSELNYLFCSGESCADSSISEADSLTRQRILALWTNFAWYGNPTFEETELLQNVTWPLVSTDGGDFLYLDIGTDLEVKNHPKEATYSKWIELYESLDYEDFDTY